MAFHELELQAGKLLVFVVRLLDFRHVVDKLFVGLASNVVVAHPVAAVAELGVEVEAGASAELHELQPRLCVLD